MPSTRLTLAAHSLERQTAVLLTTWLEQLALLWLIMPFANCRVGHPWVVPTNHHGLERLMLCFIFSLPWHAPLPRCISLSITPPFAMVFEIALLERSSCHPLAFQDGIKSCRPSGRSCQILLVSSHASGSQPTTDICDGSRPLMVSLLHQQGRSTKKLIVWPPPRPNAIMMHFDTQPT